jgi:hypothetical protein
VERAVIAPRAGRRPAHGFDRFIGQAPDKLASADEVYAPTRTLRSGAKPVARSPRRGWLTSTCDPSGSIPPFKIARRHRGRPQERHRRRLERAPRSRQTDGHHLERSPVSPTPHPPGPNGWRVEASEPLRPASTAAVSTQTVINSVRLLVAHHRSPRSCAPSPKRKRAARRTDDERDRRMLRCLARAIGRPMK